MKLYTFPTLCLADSRSYDVNGKRCFDKDHGNYIEKSNFYRRLVQTEWSMNKCPKTHSVMFTWERNWSFSKPLKIDNDIIEMKSSTKFLDVTWPKAPICITQLCNAGNPWFYQNLGVYLKDHEMELHCLCKIQSFIWRRNLYQWSKNQNKTFSF